MNASETNVGNDKGEFMREQKSFDFWVSLSQWSLPLNICWYPSIRHIAIQVLCFWLSYDYPKAEKE